MKLIKLSLAAALAVTMGYSELSAAEVEVSANVAMTSNYVWRGMTQTSNSPAVQGGFDLGYEGFYLGTWGSNIDFGDDRASLEADLYLGYANEVEKFSYDVGIIQFMYPNETDKYNFAEAYISLGYDFDVVAVGAAYYQGIDTDVDDWEPGNAWEVSLSVPLPMDISLDGTYGNYDDSMTSSSDDNTLGNYYSVSASKSFDKYDFTLAYTGMDYEDEATDDQDNVVFTVGTSF
ncbi:MAG: hypothetical protein ACJAWW_000768 [Sulfurimonas sp.]|jgi:uncharacterized protein (TIGR02001 family)